jgi:hypothetical protein
MPTIRRDRGSGDSSEVRALGTEGGVGGRIPGRRNTLKSVVRMARQLPKPLPGRQAL